MAVAQVGRETKSIMTFVNIGCGKQLIKADEFCR